MWRDLIRVARFSTRVELSLEFVREISKFTDKLGWASLYLSAH
jgi:hypothetical protein